MSASDPRRARTVLLPLAAFALGVMRGSSLPATSDAAFHLIRAGNSLLQGSLSGWSLPPGGEHAPPLGAFVTAFGALFTQDAEAKIMVSGCLLLGATAALLARWLTREEGPFVGLLGVALLLLPPGLASSFNHRPDAALGGLLLLVALEASYRGRPAVHALAPTWAATAATPWALPLALVLHKAPGIPGQRRPEAFVPAAATMTILAVLGAALPPGSRGEILRGIFGEIGPSPGALGGTLETVRVTWGGGLLLLPVALAFIPGRTRLPARLTLPVAVAVLAAALLGAPGAFQAATAALAPGVCLILARVAARWPDPAGGRRPLVLALLLPLLAMLLGTAADQRRRDIDRATSVRDAQVGAFLWERSGPAGTVAAERTGALAAMSGRSVHPLGSDGSLPQPLPRWVVFGAGRLPTTARELALWNGPTFLASYAPWIIRRGRANEVLDVVWTRRDAPAAKVDTAYRVALRDAWEVASLGDRDRTLERWRDAVAVEPPGLGLAREALGLALEQAGDSAGSAARLEEARERDPACVLARGHLADRALSADDIPRADSLVTEAFRFQRDSAELRGTRARLFAAAGYPAEAEQESARAIRLAPRLARLLVNHGTLLWRRGAQAEAKEFWRRAVRTDPEQLRYLGDFENASPDAGPPPLRPVFSDVGFRPQRPGPDPRG